MTYWLNLQFKPVISTLDYMENNFLSTNFTVNLVSLFWWRETGWHRLSTLAPDFSVSVVITSKMGPNGRVMPGFSVKNPKLYTDLSNRFTEVNVEDCLARAVRLRCERSLDHLMRYGGDCAKSPVVTAGNLFADTECQIMPGWAYYQAVCLSEDGILLFGEDAVSYYRDDNGDIRNLDGLLGEDPYRSHLVRF